MQVNQPVHNSFYEHFWSDWCLVGIWPDCRLDAPKSTVTYRRWCVCGASDLKFDECEGKYATP